MPDHYLLPNGTLKNKLGETDAAKLAHREAQIAAVREAQYMAKGITVTPSMAGLKKIHQFLFGDVYAWAGKYRDVNLSKPIEEGRARRSTFTPALEITEAAGGWMLR